MEWPLTGIHIPRGTLDYELGWIGAGGMQQLSISGIPALFVVRADGTVAEMIRATGRTTRGWRGRSTACSRSVTDQAAGIGPA